MKYKKFLLLLLFVPLLITGCEWLPDLYDPSQDIDDSIRLPDGTDINVINPSNFQGNINFATGNQTLLSKEQVYANCLTSTVYITGYTESAMIIGSGVVFSEDSTNAYIFTNAHVVEELTSIDITYSNYKKSSASLVGYNVLEDIAVLSVEKNDNYTVATLQTSDNLNPGMEVLAIGTPAYIDYSFSATSGIISKVDSPIASVLDDSYELLMLQIDASLNNGNSGGPLFDLYGNLIGINTMKLLYDYSYNEMDDMNFAIPMERATFIANSFFNNKPYTRGKIGITTVALHDLSLEEKQSYGITLDYGILILETNNSLFKINDIIVEVDGIEFITHAQFSKELYKHYKNETIEFTVYRNGQYLTINASLK